jgi:flagellar biosynthesis protein FlhG
MMEIRKGPKAIWAVGGGKGGTGKTLIASNMAISLAKRGQRVLLVDADLGGANLHTCLGLERPRYTLGSFLDGNKQDLSNYMEETGVANLFLVTGTLDYPGRGPKVRDTNRLKNALRRVDMDYVILDIGSGSSPQVMDLFLLGEMGVYVIVPEPTSIENTYRFLKEALYWMLLRGSRKKSVKAAVQRAFHVDRIEEFVPIPQFTRQLSRTEPMASRALKARLNDFFVRIVLNQVRRYEDVEVGFAVRSAIHKYFGIRVDFIGYINYDDRVIQCVRTRRPLLQNFPESNAAKCIENLTDRLLTQGQLAFDFF